jgi:hypothetical protein
LKRCFPKRAGGVAQVIEHLPSKCKALSSNSSVDPLNKRKPKNTAEALLPLEMVEWLKQ